MKKGLLLSLLLHLLILFFVPYNYKVSLEKKLEIEEIELIIQPFLNSSEKSEVNAPPAYYLMSDNAGVLMDEIDIPVDTIAVAKKDWFSESLDNTNTLTGLGVLTDYYQRRKFLENDSLKHFSLNKEPPSSRAFDFSSFKFKDSRYRSEDNFKRKDFGGGGFQIPIIPILKLLKIL